MKTSKTIVVRAALVVVILFLVMNAWWFVALPLAILGAWFLAGFVELILLGLIFDALFGMTAALGILGYVGTIVAVVVFLMVSLVKRVVRR